MPERPGAIAAERELAPADCCDLDYRLGWRWLIPVASGAVLHTLGFTQRESDLLRIELDASREDAGPGVDDVWVIDADRAERPGEATVALASRAATVVVVGRRAAAAAWTSRLPAAFRSAREFALLAPDAPRVVVPLTSAGAVAGGLALHVPGRLGARLAIGVAAALRRVGCSFPLRRRVLCVLTRDPGTIPYGARQCGLDTALPDYRGDFALYLGVAKATRRTVVVPVSAGAPRILVKMAATAEATRVLARERDALRELGATRIAAQIPRCTGVHETRGVLALYEEYRRKLRAPRHRVEQAAARFLAELSRIDRSGSDAGQFLDPLACLEEVAVRSVIARARERAATRRVVVHRTHGDFVPWNCAWTEGGFFVYDWEASERRGLAFSDAFHFVVERAMRLRGAKASADEVLGSALSFARRVASMGDLREVDVELHLALWLAGRVRARPNPFNVRLLSAFASTWLPDLG